MAKSAKKILLIDLDDSRRPSRVALLEHAGHEVEVRKSHLSDEALSHESEHDLIIISLHDAPELALEYSDRLSQFAPALPILLLLDHGVFVPKVTLIPNMEAGHPKELIEQVAKMLAGSTHIRELTKEAILSQEWQKI